MALARDPTVESYSQTVAGLLKITIVKKDVRVFKSEFQASMEVLSTNR
jgi:hypothetical protein